ncbi:hypothetical protein PR048_011652 [Dryococelus australis]|uniref:Retroviral polymerase SH3-like domain-containing protein n=1 Tax=Dryococelus australis TaxID=614101 RepID=A0ABQ9HMD0_9NEOP|nr:hypothetical protein PR048_011652 [Dryococelus australis]
MGLPYSEKKCSVCVEDKMIRLKFTSHVKSSENIGNLTHSDIGGPINPPTKQGEKYFQTLIDDYSHSLSKDKASQNVVDFIKLIKTHIALKTKRVQCDNGGEYLYGSFKNYCKFKDIMLEYTMLYTPQQNPYGKQDVKKFKIFGSKFWVLTLPRPNKLNPESRGMRLVGYCGGGYRLRDPEEDKIIQSREVMFNEDDVIFNKESSIANERNPQLEESETEDNATSPTEVIEQNNSPINRVNARGDDDEDFYGFDEKSNQTSKRPKRKVIKLTTLNYYKIYIAYCLCAREPADCTEAIKIGEGWEEEIQNEILSLEQHETWIPVNLPPEEKAIDTKWVFKTKQDGVKARLVAKGFQEESLYNVYPPAPRLPIEHNWYEQSSWDICIYIDETVWLDVWVDDMLITRKSAEYSNTGDLKDFLGTNIAREGNHIKISQHKLIDKMLVEFRLKDCNCTNTPMENNCKVNSDEPEKENLTFRELVGSLMYVATSRHLQKPTNQLWTAGKRILRYLKKTREMCLTFEPNTVQLL